jgi:hypothetical protein
MCAYATCSCGSLHLTATKEARSELSDPRFGVSRCSSRSQDLEALPYEKEM